MNNLSDIDKYNQFLVNHYVENKSTISHVEFCPGPGRGKYYISENEYPYFLKLYKNALSQSNLKLIESPKPLSPLKIDLDFRFSQHYDKHQYTEEHIKKFVKYVFIEANNYIQIDDSQKIAHIHEIPEPVIESKYNNDKKEKVHKYKDGIHVIFPYIITKKEVQLIIRKNILKNNFNDIFIKEDIKYINEKEDIYDKAIIDRAGWVMYGSSKPNRRPYELTKIYQCIDNIVDDNEIELVEKDINELSLEKIIELSSIRNKNNENLLKEDKIEEIKKDSNKTNNKELKNINKTYNKKTEDILSVEKYLDMYLPFRYNDYSCWLEIGLALHNIGDGSYEYLELWDNFSKNSDKYESTCCRAKWNSFTKKEDGYNIGSIRRWAKEDNPRLYIKYTYELGLFTDITFKALEDPYDNHIANVISSLYKDDFVYDPSSQAWYNFSEHRWKSSKKEPLDLLNAMSNTVVDFFNRCFNGIYIKSWFNKENGKDRYNAANNAEKTYKMIEKKLKDHTPKIKILNECKEGFKKDNFMDILDLNKYLIGFKNGVYDLQKGYFRNGIPTDYISMCTNYDYIEYNKNDPIFQEVKNFIKTIQPDITKEDTQRRKYLKRFMSSILQGVNSDETFHIFTGTGRNGKSKLVELLEKALGDYSGKLQMSALTKPRKNSSDANPDQIVVRNARLVSMQESNKNEKIQNGTLKEYSGGDEMTARGLFKEPIKFKPQYKIIMQVNDIPPLEDPNDPAVYERVRVIYFPVFFSKKELKDEYDKPVDTTISDKLDKWAPYFMTLLIKWYHKYFPRNDIKLDAPDCVMNFTNEYKHNNDKWSEFYTNVISVENTRIQKDQINIRDDIYKFFKIWARENDFSNIPEFLDFKHDFTKRFKILNSKIKKNIISGWRIIKND